MAKNEIRPRITNKTIFGNGIPSPLRWETQFFDWWPFLIIFGHFSGPFWPIFDLQCWSPKKWYFLSLMEHLTFFQIIYKYRCVCKVQLWSHECPKEATLRTYLARKWPKTGQKGQNSKRFPITMCGTSSCSYFCHWINSGHLFWAN